MKSRTISVVIKCPPGDVYGFVSDARNLLQWATAFCRSIRPAGDAWMLETPLGEVGIRFVERNSLGVLDHVLTFANGQRALVPMRVVANGDDSEVLFTLFQPPDMSDLQFLEDCSMVEQDLRTLKTVLEG